MRFGLSTKKHLYLESKQVYYVVKQRYQQSLGEYIHKYQKPGHNVHSTQGIIQNTWLKKKTTGKCDSVPPTKIIQAKTNITQMLELLGNDFKAVILTMQNEVKKI